MGNSDQSRSDEVDQLLRNAELRDELERYIDESITQVNVRHLTLAAENEFLTSMLEWEQAPILPIYRWFDPELRLPRPEALGDADLHVILWDVIRKLSQKRIVLDFTEHLSDRESVLPYLPRHSAVAGEEDRPLEQLSALGLHGAQRRSGGVAALLRQPGGARGMGRELPPTAAPATAAAVSPQVAPRARRRGVVRYLLSVVAIQVPPLRQRREGIPLLIERCLAQVLARLGGIDGLPHRFTPEAWQCLLAHDWPGNLPELTAVVARAVALADGRQIGRQAIVWASRQVRRRDSDTMAVPLVGELRQIERQIIEKVIEHHEGNKAAAARSLGLHRRTLYRMLRQALPGCPQ